MIKKILEFSSLKNHSDRIFQLSKEISGNIVEIGAGKGEMTCLFMQAIQGTDRIVCVIDPFESCWNDMPDSYSRPYPKKLFIENIREFEHCSNLMLVEKSSQDKTVFDKIKHLCPIPFFFIDGLQYASAVLNDIRLAERCGAEIICLDDFTRETSISQVPSGVAMFIDINKNYKLIHINGNRECYLVKK